MGAVGRFGRGKGASAGTGSGPAQRELKMIKALCLSTAPLQAALAFALLRPGDPEALFVVGWTLNAYAVFAGLAAVSVAFAGGALVLSGCLKRIS